MNDEVKWAVGKRLTVFSVREGRPGTSYWTRAGWAVVNRDGSLNLLLDVLPLNGRLHVRETAEKRAAPTDLSTETLPGESPEEAASLRPVPGPLAQVSS